MKRRTARPDDARLKFFTRELFTRFNADDDALADQADEEWERATEAYQTHLRKIVKKLPRGARALERISFHDAELVGEPHTSASGEWGRIAVAGGMAFEKSMIHLLKYELDDRIEQLRHNVAWPFSPKQVHWLYDEIDVSDENKDSFIHRILLSDGSIVVVRFKDVEIHKLPSEFFEGLALPDFTAKKKNKAKHGRELRAIEID